MAWDNVKIPSNGGDILKLESGKKYRLRIIGEPFVYQSEFNGNPSTRYAMTVWNQEEKAAQILMLPAGAFREVLGYAQNVDDWGDPELYDFVIAKTGSGLETRYTLQPSPKKNDLPDEDKKAVEAIDLKEVLNRLPSVTFAYAASEAGEDPFPKLSVKDGIQKGTLPHQDVVIEDINEDEPINLDNIPF